MVSQDAETYRKSKTKELRKLFDVKDGETLFFQGKLFSQALENGDTPLVSHKELILKEKYVSYERPECYLFTRPESESSVLGLLVRVKSNAPSEIPDFYADFDMQTFGDKKASDVKEKLVNDFGFAVSSCKVSVNGSEIGDDTGATDVIANAKDHGFDIDVELPEESLAKIRQRKNIVSEIISTEETYGSDLFKLLNHWKGNIQKKNLNVFMMHSDDNIF